MIGLNCGSGQRRFTTNENIGWVNIDINPKWEPDYIGDWNDLTKWESGTVDYVVSHHSLEHVGCGDGKSFVEEAWRVLKPGGSLLVFVPDLKALAQRWLIGQLDTQIYMTNVYGAYMGDEADRHKWGYDAQSLREFLADNWKKVKPFDWRTIEGADIARDWYILGVECVK